MRTWAFPQAKAKTILIDLEGLFVPGTPRRLRLHTNLEIYWDALRWAAKVPHEAAEITHLAPDSAVLRYRGYSLVTEANRSSPELPDYNTLAGTVPIWRDLVGYYTRFGVVDELLDVVDDRYVIMNAGDELALRFPEAPPIGKGWKARLCAYRATAGSRTATITRPPANMYVRWPSHGQPGYVATPGALVDEPVFRRHPWDWQKYHTRYVVPRPLQPGHPATLAVLKLELHRDRHAYTHRPPRAAGQV